MTHWHLVGYQLVSLPVPQFGDKTMRERMGMMGWWMTATRSNELRESQSFLLQNKGIILMHFKECKSLVIVLEINFVSEQVGKPVERKNCVHK